MCDIQYITYILPVVYYNICSYALSNTLCILLFKILPEIRSERFQFVCKNDLQRNEKKKKTGKKATFARELVQQHHIIRSYIHKSDFLTA